MKLFLKRWSLLVILILGLCAFFYFDLQRYLNFTTIKQHREIWMNWTDQHYLSAVAIFMLIYITAISVSFPGAVFLTLIGGFLFGPWLGTIYVVTSATIGASLVFFAVKIALEPWMKKRTGKWIEKMRAGFQKGAVQYLLILRLMPIFPFWVVNIVPALLGIRASIFIFTTFFGIIPGSFIYTLLGSGLGDIFDKNETPNLHIIYEPRIIIPLFILVLLSFSPKIYTLLKRKKHA
jgi:uncharacterized membrane protein YdjX (TVP38/TMEM64 family)